jgi:GT2 family glycosyltransferase
MGAISFSIDVNLAKALQVALSADIFFESGGFEGDSVARVSHLFQRAITVELAPHYVERLQTRFASSKAVEVIAGDSVEALVSLREELCDSSVLYWLDAHWCDANSVNPTAHQCPLLLELEAIRRLNGDSAIIIDDARLFLAPPPASHARDDWPTWDQLSRAIASISSGSHETLVVNDCIIVYPSRVRSVLMDYSRAYGADWLKVADLAREHAILAEAAADRLRLIESLDRSAAEVTTQNQRLTEQTLRLQMQIQEKEQAIHVNKTAAEKRGSDLEQLSQQLTLAQSALLAKEGVIGELESFRSDAVARLAALRERCEQQREALVQVEENRDSLADQFSLSERLRVDVMSAYSQVNAAFESMRSETRELATRVAEMQSDLTQQRKEADLFLNSLRDERVRALKRQQNMSADIEELRTTVDSTHAQIRVLRQSVEESNATIYASAQGLNVPPNRAMVDVSVESRLLLVNAVERLQKEANEKEAVIKELANAVDSYRAALTKPRWHRRAYQQLKNSVITAVRPKLGVLYQHPPIPLVAREIKNARPLAEEHAPVISIVTPSFRQAHLIERTIKSVVEQQYPKLEYHVQDGASDDGTVEILEKWAGKLTSWESRKDDGQSAAINLGFLRTRGEIMAWLNSDDLFMPGSLHYVAAFFRRNPNVDVLYGNRLLIDESDGLIGRWVLPGHDDKVLSWADFVPQETMFWRRSIWEKVGGVDESFRFAMDWDLLLRFRNAGAKIVHKPVYLGAFRIHEKQKTSAAINDIGVKEMERLRLRELGAAVTHQEIRKAITPFMMRHVVADKLEAFR